jgi:hypothetical protein
LTQEAFTEHLGGNHQVHPQGGLRCHCQVLEGAVRKVYPGQWQLCPVNS